MVKCLPKVHLNDVSNFRYISAPSDHNNFIDGGFVDLSIFKGPRHWRKESVEKWLADLLEFSSSQSKFKVMLLTESDNRNRGLGHRGQKPLSSLTGIPQAAETL